MNAKTNHWMIGEKTENALRPRRQKYMLSKFIAGLLLSAILIPCTAFALPVGDAVNAVADQLVGAQGTSGAWSGEEGFTGSIVAGLANAYQITGNAAYKNAAVLGGDYIINSAEGNFYGDEAYALALLGEITGIATYEDTARNFYNGLDTYGYIGDYKATERSNAVFYVAQHTVAAHRVGATDAGVWREGLIQYLARIGDDAADYPVMSLGIATWALAQTGPMDDTGVDPFGLIGEDYWTDVALCDLPGILSSHIVSSGEYAGSFYYRFDHTPDSVYYGGYSEDTAFGLLGLIAANALVDWDFDVEILAGRMALASGIAGDGIVYEHIWSGGASYYAYGGEVLQAIPEPASLFLLAAGALLLRRRRCSLG